MLKSRQTINGYLRFRVYVCSSNKTKFRADCNSNCFQGYKLPLTEHYDPELAWPRGEKRKLEENDRVRTAIIDARTTELLATRAEIFQLRQ